MREKNVPCVPANMDAFLFLDHDTWERSEQASFGTWRKRLERRTAGQAFLGRLCAVSRRFPVRGWQIKSVSLQAGTEFVTGARPGCISGGLCALDRPTWMRFAALFVSVAMSDVLFRWPRHEVDIEAPEVHTSLMVFDLKLARRSPGAVPVTEALERPVGLVGDL